MNLADLALAPGRTSQAAARPAFFTAEGPVTNDAFQRSVAAAVAGLRALELQPGDKVLLRLTNSIEFAAAFLAVVWVGAVPVLQNSQLGADELAHITAAAAPALILLARAPEPGDPLQGLALQARRAVVTRAGLVDESGNPIAADAAQPLPAAHDVSPDTPAFMVFSSGTTGRPKGIVHAHRWLEGLGNSNRNRIPPQADDVALATGEWSFVSALGHNVLFALRNGVPGSILEDRASPERILATIARDRVTLLYSVATLYRRILGHEGIEHGHDLSSLRGVNSTGEPLEPAVQQAWKQRFGCPVWEHYGISEAQMVLGHGPLTPARPGTVGIDWGAGAAVLDENLQPVPAGTLGTLAFSAAYPGFFLGYLGDEVQTRRCFRGGWYVTSDLAVRDADGYVAIVGRADDCFKSKGVLIAPREIEDALLGLDGVVQASVFPIPDAETGYRIGAALVLRSALQGDLAAQFRKLLAGRIAPFKQPHVVVAWDSLPTNNNGKTQRSEVARRVIAGLAAAEA
ncbi:acyl-CoA synthetase [Lacisediminimonas profundi]|uniref:acyl-CoA synthetase n=1 Tax=Lacisediminimonas profundi TaxID=2603856 RepID=UPI00124B64CA|nr:acyl-CoA synthetase [Lacisediminimonas profundi]